MKKILLSAALAAVAAFSASAQDIPALNGQIYGKLSDRPADDEVGNVMYNGNFEDPSYTTKPNGLWGDYTLIDDADVIPGWGHTSSTWNAVVQIMDQAPDGYWVEEGDGNDLCARIFLCPVNGWARCYLYNTVENLTVGTTYTLDFLTMDCINTEDEGGHYGVKIMEYIPGEEATQGKAVAESTALQEDKQQWDYYRATFVATSDKMTIALFAGHYLGEGHGDAGTHFAAFDEVRLYDPNNPGAGIGNVAVDNSNAPVMIFNLQGVLMPAGAELNGVYIQKQGNQVSKVIF